MKHLMLGTFAVLSMPSVERGLLREEIVHIPKENVEVTKTFEVSSTLSLLSMSMVVDGEEMPEMGDLEQTTSHGLTLVMTDEVTSLDDDGVKSFTRSFEEIAASDVFEATDPMGGDFGHDFELESELEGLDVEFTRGEEGYEANFSEGGTGEAELLDGLVATVDFVEFLPTGEVEVGAEWEAELDVLDLLEDPAGNLTLVSEDGNHGAAMLDPEAGTDYPEADREGTITLEYLGMRDVEGTELAAISIQVEVSESLDLTEYMAQQNQAAPDDLPEGMMMPEIAFLLEESEREGEGLLLWHTEAGRLHSLELTLEVTDTQTMGMVMVFQDSEQEMEQVMEMEGTEEYSVSFEG